MALELPGWLVNAFYVIGMPWPGIDEDQLWAWAQDVRAFADDVTSSSARTHQAVAELAASSQSSSVGTLAAHWDHRSQLVADLHGPMTDFADALDIAADAVWVQKLAVIVAVTVLVEEFIATQAAAFFTFGLDEAALPAEIISTKAVVKAALEFLEAELLGKLIGIAVEDVTSHLSRFLGEFLGVALPVVGEVAGLKMAYSSVRDAAQQARAHAAETEETGNVAYQENANRDIEDPGEVGDVAGDGGRWAAVVQAVEQGLLYIAQVLFKGLSEAISEIQEATASALDGFASAIADADESLGREVRPPDVAGDIGGSAGEPGQDVPAQDLDAARDRWKTLTPRFHEELKRIQGEYPAPREVASATLDDATRSMIEQGWKRMSQVAEDTTTPAMHRIAAEDPYGGRLIGLEKRVKGLDQTVAKVAKTLLEHPDLKPEQALANLNDVSRYTITYPEERYTDGVTATVQRLQDLGYQRVTSTNFWGAEKVKGINSAWEVPGTGQRFEVQFHTGISFEATRLTHPAYEHMRIPIPKEIPDEERAQRIAGNTAMQGFQSYVNKNVPVPPGALEYPDYRRPEYQR